uniref:Uncharacterized protein n=1 Tax=Lygus hesperus TaxID=30085 RepID=A0A146LE53_LYGHE
MWITVLLLQAFLYMTTSATSTQEKLCCYDNLFMKDITTRTDENGRVVLVMKILTYASLNSKSSMPDELKLKAKKSCGHNDIVGILIDEKLGGFDDDESVNAVPMNTATHVMWRYKVTEPVYYYLREHPESSALFSVNLYYADLNASRPYFFDVNVRHAYCVECSKYSADLAKNPLHEQYVVKGFISNPLGSEAVISYLYGSEESLVTYGVGLSQLFRWVHLSIHQYNETMQKKYERVSNSGGGKGQLVRRVEWTEKTIVFAHLDAERQIQKDRDFSRISALGNDDDVPGTLISPRLGGSYWANFVPVRPRTFIELENVATPIIEYFNDTSNQKNRVALRVDVLYEDNRALRPAGFFYSATIKMIQSDGSEKIISGWPDFSTPKFIKN